MGRARRAALRPAALAIKTKLEQSSSSDWPEPAEGARFVKALLAIRNAKVRRALIGFAEALAHGFASQFER
jgi:hypothetical protein